MKIAFVTGLISYLLKCLFTFSLRILDRRNLQTWILSLDCVSYIKITSYSLTSDLHNYDQSNLDCFTNAITDSSFVSPLIYGFMGSSRDIAIGPVAVVSLLLGTMLQNEIDPKNKHVYQRLAFTATLSAGVTQFALGFFRYLLTSQYHSCYKISFTSQTNSL